MQGEDYIRNMSGEDLMAGTAHNFGCLCLRGSEFQAEMQMVGWTSSAEAYLCLRFTRALLQSEEEVGKGKR